MKLALIGYGKMGKAIEKMAVSRGHQIVARIDMDPAGWALLETQKPDAAIEFSIPEKAAENIKKCLDLGIPVLSGTTGWLAHKPGLDALSAQTGVPFFYASNYSLGVNLFFKLNEFLAQLTSAYNQYQVTVEEIHHTQKKDAPSGTAITLAEGILKHHKTKKGWALKEDASAEQLAINSKRIDPYPGEHTITYESAVDTIEIRHTAHSRDGFALGAVLVAEWLPAQKGVKNMTHFLEGLT